jgi:hypothetical protein
MWPKPKHFPFPCGGEDVIPGHQGLAVRSTSLPRVCSHLASLVFGLLCHRAVPCMSMSARHRATESAKSEMAEPDLLLCVLGLFAAMQSNTLNLSQSILRSERSSRVPRSDPTVDPTG